MFYNPAMVGNHDNKNSHIQVLDLSHVSEPVNKGFGFQDLLMLGSFSLRHIYLNFI